MTDARIIAEATNYDELIAGLRTRKGELQLTDDALETLAGMARGHIGKLFGDVRTKGLGRVSLGRILGTLAVKLVLVVDDKARADMEPHWEKRQRPAVEASRLATLGQITIKRVFPVIASEMGKRGGQTRMALMTPAELKRHQSNAGKKRWSKMQGKVK